MPLALCCKRSGSGAGPKGNAVTDVGGGSSGVTVYGEIDLGVSAALRQLTKLFWRRCCVVVLLGNDTVPKRNLRNLATTYPSAAPAALSAPALLRFPLATVHPYQPKHITPTGEQVAVQMSAGRTLVIEANAGAAKPPRWRCGMPRHATGRACRPNAAWPPTPTPARRASQAALPQNWRARAVVARAFASPADAFAPPCCRALWPARRADRRPEALRALRVGARAAPSGPAEHERWPEELQQPGDAGLYRTFWPWPGSRHAEGTTWARRQPPPPDYAGDLGIGYTQLRCSAPTNASAATAGWRRAAVSRPRPPPTTGPPPAPGDTAASLRPVPVQPQMVLVDGMRHERSLVPRAAQHCRFSQCQFCGVGDRDGHLRRPHGADHRVHGRCDRGAYGRPWRCLYHAGHSGSVWATRGSLAARHRRATAGLTAEARGEAWTRRPRVQHWRTATHSQDSRPCRATAATQSVLASLKTAWPMACLPVGSFESLRPEVLALLAVTPTTASTA